MSFEQHLSGGWTQDLVILKFLQGSRWKLISVAALSIIAIAVIDWYFKNDISFGFLYLFPMLILGSALNSLQMASVAAICTGLTEAFDPFPWSMTIGASRLVLTFAAFFGTGFFGVVLARSRQTASDRVEEMRRDAELSRETEEQLESLIASSPAAIITMDEAGRIQIANGAAHQLLCVDSGELEGKAIEQFIPALAKVPPSKEAPFFHTEMECRARRQNEDVFLAHVWFSTYPTMSGPRLAAVVFDSSEELRDRAEFNLQQVLTGSKVLVGALCHEIRNISGAIALVHAKLRRDMNIASNEDFRALGSLVEALEKMAGLELRQTIQAHAESLDILSVLEELRIVIEPSFEDSAISIKWELARTLPRVTADRHAVLQVFLNVAKNSQRAMEDSPVRWFIVRAVSGSNAVVIRFIDTGPGVQNPESLFTPFQPGAQASGLGLYLSRTFLRSFRGDIEYEPTSEGSCFAVTLSLAAHPGDEMKPGNGAN